MSEISKVLFPAIVKWMELNHPASTVEEACNYYSTSEILAMCNDIIFDENLTEGTLFALLTQENYQIINAGGGLQRWIIK